MSCVRIKQLIYYSIDSRHQGLLERSSLARDAAAAAISGNELQLALAWLEQGRSIVWGQILQLRTQVDDLRLAHPKIAEELIQITNGLEKDIPFDHYSTGKDMEPSMRAVQRRHQLARDWERTVGQVRQMAGFERFLLPKQFSELRNAVKDTPIVVLNASVYGKLQLCSTLSPTSDEHLRIQWCPTGPLAFLPIHAAGIYNADGTSSTSLSDIAISSYTPSLTALLNTTRRITNETSPFKILAVIQPDAPGAPRLPGTTEELKMIRKHAPDSSVHALEGQRATIEDVSSGMEECAWVHLACHGIQDTSHPMGSGLLLHNGRLHLSNIIQKRLTHAEFAFLSACQTATGDQSRPDEAIHLAAGMLLAGYRGVVATMWSIRDDDAPFVADKFYGRVLKNGQPRIAKAAEALHFAIQELRRRPGGCKFLSWVPFIYMGV
ncbi:hypothetical protein BD410DRAFT_842533 [Rickenella mellea]|uniref:CHAT domain-containing protein n=1 Tax=Rickenella mellea TaxID=50990 RepID=A0A4Y7PTT5_9AGAM|nr:hypothetical protein BD410DRAFT_842533 [Rickenella mellea]